MAVTKMWLVSVFVVLAITYNQGAARPMDSTFRTKNGLSSSEVQMNADGDITFTIATTLKKNFAITINGTLDPNDSTFTVELPSLSGRESCQFKFIYADNKIYITPAIDEHYANTDYNLNVTPGSAEGPTFSLIVRARVDKIHYNDMLGMIFNGNDDGPSDELICKIKNFEDINQIVIKEGVANVDSVLFDFMGNH